MKALVAIATFASLSLTVALPALGATPGTSPKLPIKRTNTEAIYAFIRAGILKSEADRGVTTDVYEPVCSVNRITAGPDQDGAEKTEVVKVLACVTYFSSSDRWNGTDYTVFAIEGENLTKVIYQSGDGSF